MNLTEAKKKIKALGKTLKKIKSKYPDVEFTFDLKQDINFYWNVYKEYLYLSVDVKCCEDADELKMCSDCDCWKIAKKNKLKIKR
jgi:hypothetical protein